MKGISYLFTASTGWDGTLTFCAIKRDNSDVMCLLCRKALFSDNAVRI